MTNCSRTEAEARDADDVGLTYDQLLKGAENYQKDGDTLPLTQASSRYEWGIPKEFWKHYCAVTGKDVNDDGTIFQCCPENDD